MKAKKIVSIILTMVMLTAILAACSQEKTTDTGSESTETQTQQMGSDSPDATELELWVFVELHGKFYQAMLEKWNAANPDKQIKLNVNVMPYDDMHNKLQIALHSGEGTPDLVDIELGKFSNFTQGTPQLMDLTEAAAPYREDIVESRLKIYSKEGKLYGFPTHVGATVAFYNTELLEAAGIDYTTIKTWEDFKNAGVTYYEQTGQYFGTADTFASWVLNALMAQYGTDYTDESGNLQVNNSKIAEALQMLRDMQEVNAIGTVPGGQPDTEEAYGAFNSGNYAVAIMPLWQMSRYTDYMPDLSGKIAIAPIPVIEGSNAKSVGGGGTGTAVIDGKEHSALAAEFMAYAKLSKEGNIAVWESLGFDPCNMSIWTDETVTHNPDNEYVKYFINNPFDVLNVIKDSIAGLDSMTSEKYPSINDYFVTTTLNQIFEDGTPVQDALDEAQSYLENELQ